MTASPPPSDDRPPHVVWLMCDQLRADALGFAGHPLVRTPHLDRLAGRGVVFDNLYAQSSVCIPSRACMITGKYLRALGMSNGAPLLDPRHDTLPELLQRAGYRTGLFGKLHLTPQEYTHQTLGSDTAISDAGPFLAPAGLGPMPEDPAKRNYGFQHVVGHEDALWGEYRRWLARRDPDLAAMLPHPGMKPWDGWKRQGAPPLADVGSTVLEPEQHPSWFIAEQAAEFFEARHKEAPLFLHVSFVDPHHPWDPPEAMAAQYPPEQMPLPRYRDAGNVVWPPTLAARLPDFSKVSDELARKTIAYYYAMIEMIDRSVGRLVEAIERAGELERTVFIFTADHGEMLGDYGLWRKGSFHYDCMIRLPGFVSWPARLAGGGRVDGLVQAIDLAPTLLGLLGMDVPDAMQGRDWSAELRQQLAIGREWIYCELFTTRWGPYVDCWTLRTSGAKLNYYPIDRTGHLFDLTRDSDERHDVFNDAAYRPLRDEMMANLLEEICRQADPLPRVLSQY